MYKDNAKYYLPLVQALAEGKTIQTRWPRCAAWNDCEHPDFVLGPSHYRIKPEPRVLYILLRPDGKLWGSTFNKEEAELLVRHYSEHDGIIRKFMEVVED